MIHRAVGSVSSFGGSPVRRQEIGLGDATSIKSLSVTWPGGTKAETIDRGIPLDSHVRLKEGAGQLERLSRPKMKFSVEP